MRWTRGDRSEDIEDRRVIEVDADGSQLSGSRIAKPTA